MEHCSAYIISLVYLLHNSIDLQFLTLIFFSHLLLVIPEVRIKI